MFEKVSPRFLSPEARHETANEASKFLNLNDHETTNERNKPPACTETDDDLRAFRELEIVMSSEKVKRPRSAINYEEDLATQKPEDAPFESEMLVEWIDPLDHDQFRNSKPVFAFNGLTEEVKFELFRWSCLIYNCYEHLRRRERDMKSLPVSMRQ